MEEASPNWPGRVPAQTNHVMTYKVYWDRPTQEALRHRMLRSWVSRLMWHQLQIGLELTTSATTLLEREERLKFFLQARNSPWSPNR